MTIELETKKVWLENQLIWEGDGFWASVTKGTKP